MRNLEGLSAITDFPVVGRLIPDRGPETTDVDALAESFKNLPSKILNPAWAEWKAVDYQNQFDLALATKAEGERAPDKKTAGRLYKKSKSQLQSLEKDLKMYKRMISESSKYKKAIDYRVSEEQIDSMLEHIKMLRAFGGVIPDFENPMRRELNTPYGEYSIP